MSRIDPIARLAAAQAERAQAALLRRLRTVETVDGTALVIGGRRLTGFASNDYLGLAGHPELVEALGRGARQWGVGAGAAHLLGGHREVHAALEADLAHWTGRDKALLFSTGYLANLGALQALLQPGDLCVQDKLNHACLLDGARLSGATLRRYRHVDVAAAERQLAADPAAAALLATDGVFSMDGDVAPLPALAAACRAQEAVLMVDDAHGLGVLGPEGAGSLAEAGIGQDQAPVLMATLGKAIGVGGAFIAGPAALIDALVQFARPHVYTTAPPPPLAAATRVAVRLAREETWRRERLAALIAQFREGAAHRGLRLADSRTPIQPVLIGASDAALAAARALEDAGFFVPAIRPPTVPAGTARLRVTLTAAHAPDDVERLLDALRSGIAMKPPADDLQARQVIWQAFSTLYLDTGYRHELREAARCAAASVYAEAELRAILLHEVHPVLRGNLAATAGVWDGFDPAWLSAAILRRSRRPRWLRLDACMRGHAEHLWRMLAPRIRRLRALTS